MQIGSTRFMVKKEKVKWKDGTESRLNAKININITNLCLE